MITVTLIRHAQIPANINRAFVGCRTDQMLTEEGLRQAAELQLPAVDRVFVSPMMRCRQTAEIVYPNMTYEVVEDFREMDFGIFEGKTAADMSDSEKFRMWVDGMCQDQIPDGESMEDFDGRVTKAFKDALAMCADGEQVGLVVHGGTVMAIMGAFNDEGRKPFEYHLNNCEYYVCTCPLDGDIALHRIGGVEPRGYLPPKPEEAGGE